MIKFWLLFFQGKRRTAHKSKHNVVPRAVTFKNTEEVVKSLSGDMKKGKLSKIDNGYNTHAKY